MGHFSDRFWHTSATMRFSEGSHSLVCPQQYSWRRGGGVEGEKPHGPDELDTDQSGCRQFLKKYRDNSVDYSDRVTKLQLVGFTGYRRFILHKDVTEKKVQYL